MYTSEREPYRKMFYVTWQKHQAGLMLDATEKQLIEVILLHPEYHILLNDEKASQQEFMLEENPFLHMSLHIAVREQIQLDRPSGIRNIYEKLSLTNHDALHVEHLMTDCLARVLWEAQQSGKAPNDSHYLDELGIL